MNESQSFVFFVLNSFYFLFKDSKEIDKRFKIYISCLLYELYQKQDHDYQI